MRKPIPNTSKDVWNKAVALEEMLSLLAWLSLFLCIIGLMAALASGIDVVFWVLTASFAGAVLWTWFKFLALVCSYITTQAAAEAFQDEED